MVLKALKLIVMNQSKSNDMAEIRSLLVRNKQTPIQNLHQLATPEWAELSSSRVTAAVTAGASSCSPAAAAASSAPAGSSFGTPTRCAVETVTSVQPRSRPKGEDRKWRQTIWTRTNIWLILIQTVHLYLKEFYI